MNPIMKWNNGCVQLTAPADQGERIRILLAGDFCPIRRTEAAILSGDSAHMVASMEGCLRDADLSVLNLEAPLTLSESGIPKTGPNLRGDPGCAAFFNETGFQVANLANNHIRDMGDRGVVDTIDTLERQGISTVGAGSNLDHARHPLTLECKGRSIAILAYAENEFSIAGDGRAGAANLDPEQNLEQIRQVSDQHDATLVLVHGGNEYCPIPSPGMRRRYRALARAGATAVVATHTHCPQGVEIVDGVPIVYSMGNFLFDSPWDTPAPDRSMWWKGYLVQLDFSDGRTCSLECIPHASGPDGSRVDLLAGQPRSTFLAYLKHLSELIHDESRMQQLWEAWCLKEGPFWMDAFRRARLPEGSDDAGMTMMILRNGFTCEAHREVVTTWLKMICENRMTREEVFRKELADLQAGIWEQG